VNEALNCSTNTTTPARRDQAHSHLNHVAIEDAQAGLDIILGMILVNKNNAIVLFQSGASHSFVATNFVQKYNLPLSILKNQIRGGGILSQPHSSLVKSN
jgi:hypothetical protein